MEGDFHVFSFTKVSQSLSAWLFVIRLNRSKNKIRRQKVRPVFPGDVAYELRGEIELLGGKNGPYVSGRLRRQGTNHRILAACKREDIRTTPALTVEINPRDLVDKRVYQFGHHLWVTAAETHQLPIG